MGDLKMVNRQKTCLHALSDSAIICQRRGLAKVINWTTIAEEADNHCERSGLPQLKKWATKLLDGI